MPSRSTTTCGRPRASWTESQMTTRALGPSGARARLQSAPSSLTNSVGSTSSTVPRSVTPSVPATWRNRSRVRRRAGCPSTRRPAACRYRSWSCGDQTLSVVSTPAAQIFRLVRRHRPQVRAATHKRRYLVAGVGTLIGLESGLSRPRMGVREAFGG